MIHCPNCGHLNPEGASQCEACYETLPSLTSCPTCQASVPDDAFFCPQCGASLPRGVSNSGSGSPTPSVVDTIPPTNVVAQEALGRSPFPPTEVAGTPVSSELPPTNVVNPAAPPADLPTADVPPTDVGYAQSPPDVPPTDVGYAQSPPDLPPTNVVHPVAPPADLPPADLPPTNVVNPIAPPADLPPTNVVHPSVPETLPPRPVTPPSDLPPTNVVHPPEPSTPEETPPDLQPPTFEDDVEEAPTLVVSPPADGEIKNIISEPPPVAQPPESPPEEVPVVAPTIPPQSFEESPPDLPPVAPPPLPTPEPEPPVFEEVQPPASPVFEEAESALPTSPESFEEPTFDTSELDPTPPTFSEVLNSGNAEAESTSGLVETEVPDAIIPDPPMDIPQDIDTQTGSVPMPSATTVQPFAVPPSVGETMIQIPKPALTLTHERSGSVITLPNDKPVLLMGKTTDTVLPDVDVVGFVDSDVVSRRHAAIIVEGDRYFVEDLGSSNGTYINNEAAPQGDRTPLQSGDRICLGRENKVCFIFKVS